MSTVHESKRSERLVSAGRVVLTLGAVVVFLYLVVLAARVHASFRKGQELSQTVPPVAADNLSLQRPSTRPLDPLWPQFPRTAPSKLTRTVLNGVDVLCEDWQSAASPADILSYYRQQMSARGWRDATEETYGLQPELQARAGDNKPMQDEKYLELYRKIMDWNLVLRRGDWSMHILTEPKNGPMPGTAVKIYAAATPSIKDLFASLVPGARRGRIGQASSPGLEATQFGAGQRYHTTVNVKSMEPLQAFQESLANCRADGWQPVMLQAAKQGRPGHVAWLRKGTQFAILNVEPADDGRRSSVTLMEVTSDQLSR